MSNLPWYGRADDFSRKAPSFGAAAPNCGTDRGLHFRDAGVPSAVELATMVPRYSFKPRSNIASIPGSLDRTLDGPSSHHQLNIRTLETAYPQLYSRRIRIPIARTTRSLRDKAVRAGCPS